MTVPKGLYNSRTGLLAIVSLIGVP